VRLLEYSEIPGLIIDKRPLFLQRVATSSKRAKHDHLNVPAVELSNWSTSPFPFSQSVLIAECLVKGSTDKTNASPQWNDPSLLSEETHKVIQDVVKNITGDPSPEAVSAHISDIEQDIRNLDFRLQWLLHQRASVVDSLASARRLVVNPKP
jgi:hypothetical protein